jgi:SpoVK/Ycf46/Vps4 family AAA+-type ATPase
LKTLSDAINEGDNDFNTQVLKSVQYVYTLKGAAFSKFQQIVKRETKLTKLDLIELSKVHFSSAISARLSDAIVGFLAEKEGIQFEAISRVQKNLIHPNDIAHKELIYGPSEKSQLPLVAQALEVDAFISLQQRLEARALPKGISVLLHGSPGTGKTETVYQLAKKTQRCVYKVDISETKSMWFGESQKLIKRVFDTYEQLVKSEKNTPILLFNEADGLISKRKDVGNSAVADTENAIQNILLEELERFNGIFFATTNFVQNMDDAFERRFLFKVKFEKPDSESLTQIWQHKLPILLPKQAAQLARTFAFSGGEIDNIVRKVLMHELLQDETVSFEQVLEFSRQEKWSKQTVGKMGFGSHL